MDTLIGIDELKTWRRGQGRVAFVPTMGALHDGHLSLIEHARTLGDTVLASIFVNPKQFGPKEDFATYPRMLAEDCEKLAKVGAAAVFVPNTAEMYPEGFQTYVINESMANVLCGRSRPGHFQGVLTVVLKLFNMTRCDAAIFGKKDYQQWRLIERMVRDLALPVEVIGMPTLREKDGLAMSSRNLRLSAEERKFAPTIHKGLRQAQEKFQAGERDASKLCKQFEELLKGQPAFKLDYVEVRAQDDLGAFTGPIDRAAVMLVAAHLGSVRLIDNLELGSPR